MTKFLNISTDTTLGGSSPSDVTVSSQKAIKTYVDSQTGTAPAFANIVGQPTDNANLATALNAKYDASNPNGYTSNVGTVTSVNNVSPVNGNVTLSIPAAQVNSDWNASSGVAQILNKPTIPTVNNATLTITQGGTSKGTFTANASSDVTIALDAGGGSSRNVGEIVQSTVPLTDAGLHLLDGSLISGSGSYADFVTYIAGLVSDYPDLFDTEANWQTAVTTYGVCGKFVYDSVNGTVRLPKIIGFTESTIDTTVLGDLVEAGLPNITGEIAYKCMNGSREPSGAFTKISESTGVTPSGTNKDRNIEVDFDASLSNSIYGNSTTVQPQAIKVLYYIVIATSVKTEIEVDIDEVMTDLNGKVDISDLSTIYPVVETYINGTDWYRVYSDGWVEQGGAMGTNSTVTLLKPMADTNYYVDVTWSGGKSGNFYAGDWRIDTLTTTSFYTTATSNGANVKGSRWIVKGYGA